MTEQSLNPNTRMPYISEWQYKQFIERTPYDDAFIETWLAWQAMHHDDLAEGHIIAGLRYAREDRLALNDRVVAERTGAVAYEVGRRLLIKAFEEKGRIMPDIEPLPLRIGEPEAADTPVGDIDATQGVRFVRGVRTWFERQNPTIAGREFEDLAQHPGYIDAAIFLGATEVYVATARALTDNAGQ